jgi:hypothetical protein
VKTRSYGSGPGVANLSASLSDRRQRCLKIKTFYPWNVPTCPALKRRAVVLFQPLAAGPPALTTSPIMSGGAVALRDTVTLCWNTRTGRKLACGPGASSWLKPSSERGRRSLPPKNPRRPLPPMMPASAGALSQGQARVPLSVTEWRGICRRRAQSTGASASFSHSAAISLRTARDSRSAVAFASCRQWVA